MFNTSFQSSFKHNFSFSPKYEYANRSFSTANTAVRSKLTNTKLAVIGMIFLSATALIYNYSKDRKINKDKGIFPPHYQEVKKLRRKWAQTFPLMDKGYEWEITTTDSGTNKGYEWDIKARELISRAEEIRNLYKDTHFVFIHGQSAEFIPLQILIDAEAEKQGYKKPYFFKYLRMPKTWEVGEKTKLIKEAFEYAQEKTDEDSEYLISADAYFLNREYQDSAYYFLSRNESVLTYENVLTYGRSAIRILANKILLEDKQLSFQQKENTVQIINKISKGLNYSNSCGILWVFCIPKKIIHENSEEILYRSHPYGKLCNCHIGKEIEILQNLQNDILDESNKCSGYYEIEKIWDVIRYTERIPLNIPQYRIAAYNLTPENEVFIFRLTHLGKRKLRSIKKEIRHSIGVS